MSEKNPDLVALHNSLGDIVDALVIKQEAATDPAIIKAIDAEMSEVLFRIINVQRALFKAQTAKITAAVAEVSGARAELDAAIAKIEQLNKFLKTISAFLGLVDKVIDLVKLV
jgi:hypothetical protein